MQQFSIDQIAALVAPQQAPCISLYMPTHRSHPDRDGDPIRYRNLLRQLRESLAQKHDKRELEPLMLPFEALSENYDFWNNRTEGLAILAAGGSFQVIDLLRPVKELLVVADSFHIKPLLRILQSADRYQVLCLGQHGGRLLEGNRDALDWVQVSSQISGPMAHDRDRQSHKDVWAADVAAYLRPIDAAVREQHSQPTGLPLVLVALPEMQHAFREVSKNEFLVDGGIAHSPDDLDVEQIRQRAWTLFEPVYLQRLEALTGSFLRLRETALGADLLDDVGAAAVAGRVKTLLIEADREIPGRIDPASGRAMPDGLCNPEVDDMIDDIAEAVLRTRGEVVVVPAERMPVSTGVAAILRF